MFSERVQCKCKVYYPCTVKVYCILHITRVCTVYVYSLFFTHVQSTYINVTMSHVANHMSRVRGHRRTITCRMSEVIGGQSLDNESRKMSKRFCRAVWVSQLTVVLIGAVCVVIMMIVMIMIMTVSWLWSSVDPGAVCAVSQRRARRPQTTSST